MTDEHHTGYGRRYLRFVRAHWEAFYAAYTAPSPHTARNELERLRREYATLPPRHVCTCPRIRHWPVCERTGKCECPQLMGYHCLECRHVAEQLLREQLATEMGRSSVPGPRTPLVVVLDLEAGYAA